MLVPAHPPNTKPTAVSHTIAGILIWPSSLKFDQYTTCATTCNKIEFVVVKLMTPFSYFVVANMLRSQTGGMLIEAQIGNSMSGLSARNDSHRLNLQLAAVIRHRFGKANTIGLSADRTVMIPYPRGFVRNGGSGHLLPWAAH